MQVNEFQFLIDEDYEIEWQSNLTVVSILEKKNTKKGAAVLGSCSQYAKQDYYDVNRWKEL